MLNVSLTWKIISLTDAHCETLCTWKYPSPYELYNWPPWETMLKEQSEFADQQIRTEQYRAVVDAEDMLIGFVQFFPIVGVTRLGLGLRPDLCGQGSGLGTQFVQLVTLEALNRTPGNEVDLEVLIWNERAIRTYQRAGFAITDTYERQTPSGPAKFHCMVYGESDPD